MIKDQLMPKNKLIVYGGDNGTIESIDVSSNVKNEINLNKKKE